MLKVQAPVDVIRLGEMGKIGAHRRTPIDDCSNRGAVALAIGGDAKKSAKCRHDDDSD